MREPRFWRRGGNPWPGRLLSPAGALYGAATILRRWGHQPYRAPVPVVVAGGITLGGAGKTPLALALADLLAVRHPHFLSRGYGGSEAGPLRVDPSRHGAKDVGDEPLLLQRRTGVPVVVGADRVGAAYALLGAHSRIDVIVSDDGLQHLALERDVEVLVFDERGIGNGRLLPAGPLRERMPKALNPRQIALYNADAATTRLPGYLAQRALAGVTPASERCAR